MDRDLHYLQMASRLALRGHGGAEPNPMVGAVVVSRTGEVVGWGFHRQCGCDHAEVVALNRAGDRARGSTLFCTLEPCNHTGRTPPCTQAIINAGIARVVIAQRDPNPVAACGLERLGHAGIPTDVLECKLATHIRAPFVHRIRTGLPWVIAKWAQTIDGRIATRPPHSESQWISCERSRRMVHRERGRADAILTGIGTVLKDDPMLTARNVRRRRIARRIVIDPHLQIPPTAKLIATAREAPTIIFCSENVLDQHDKVSLLRTCGVTVTAAPVQNDAISLDCILRDLAAQHDVSSVLVEAGTGLLSCLFQQRLVNECWVFTAPVLLGDEQARSCVSGMTTPRLLDGVKMDLVHVRRCGQDIVALYRTA